MNDQPALAVKQKNLIQSLLNHELSGGIFLILCTILSLLLTNVLLGESYIAFWNISLAAMPLNSWIDDGLMTIFFLYVGLQLKREIYYGELHNIKRATLPIFAAIGGMLIPALIYLLFNFNDSSTIRGAGIPVATDIAFALAVITLVGHRVPIALKLFLMALAVIDDLGAMVIIAFFYGSDLHFTYLLSALGTLALLLLFNYLKIKSGWIYIIVGIIAWYFMRHSGIHATIAGVLVAFTLPSHADNPEAFSTRLEALIEKPVTFIILPLFALSSTAILVNFDSFATLGHNYGLGIFFGLVIGKPIGITFASWIACRLGICTLHPSLSWPKIIGAACLGGIGFTMSIFITLLAFDPALHGDYINNAKLVIIISSTVAAIIGFVILKLLCRQSK